MSKYSIDVAYAWSCLGLTPGASLEEVENVLARARGQPGARRERIDQVQRFVMFFIARSQLGEPDATFAEIRKSYHRQAMELHPDRNRLNPAYENRLKEINAAFAIVDSIHREAREFYLKDEATRRAIEKDAAEATLREGFKKRAPAADASRESPEQGPREGGARRDAGTIKYFAASVPRFIRTARLSHLRLENIIGSWFIKERDELSYAFDVIMLPEREFVRARTHLGVPNLARPSLGRGVFAPPYIPMDVREVSVPASEADPREYARKYFRKTFGLEPKSPGDRKP